jgi:hypothetical protein
MEEDPQDHATKLLLNCPLKSERLSGNQEAKLTERMQKSP